MLTCKSNLVQDINYYGELIVKQASIVCPVLLSPVAQKKRMIPDLFCWSQNFLGILLILYMTEHSRTLIDIRTRLCGIRFNLEYDKSVRLMLDWIEDLKDVDSIAMWCWRITRNVYHDRVSQNITKDR